MKKKSISVVIPNWNGETLLREHFKQVYSAAGDYEIIVVDDASTDGSVAYLKEEYPDVVIARNSHQLGFAGAVNIGVSQASGELIVLLNTDVVPTKGFLDPVIPHFDDDSVFGVGLLDRSHEAGGVVHRGRGTARWARGLYIHAAGDPSGHTTAWVSGGSGVFRRSVWDQLGGMDTMFSPFYWEDIDVSYRALKAGFRLVFEPNGIVDHYHARGAIRTGYSSLIITSTAYRNQFLFVWKNLTDTRIWISHILWTPVHLASALMRGDVAMLWGYVRAVCRIPRMLRSRIRAGVWFRVPDTDIPLT